MKENVQNMLSIHITGFYKKSITMEKVILSVIPNKINLYSLKCILNENFKKYHIDMNYKIIDNKTYLYIYSNKFFLKRLEIIL